MALYLKVYENLSVRVNDMIARSEDVSAFDAQEALDMMVSYSIAEEGSNNLYIRLI